MPHSSNILHVFGHLIESKCHVSPVLPPCRNPSWSTCFRIGPFLSLTSFRLCSSITENKYIQVFHVCMYGHEPNKWILSHYSKIHSSIPYLSLFFFTPYPPSPLSFLHSQARSVGCQSSPKSKIKQWNKKRRYVRWLWCRSFLMVSEQPDVWR